MFFDMHADIWTNCFWEYNKGNKNVINTKFRKKFKEGNMLGGIFVIWLDEYNNPKNRFENMLKTMCKEITYCQDTIHIIKSPIDFELAQKSNKFAVVLGIEGLAGIEDNIDYIYLLHQLGIRHIGLTWNETNYFATGQSGYINRGLTPLGIEALKIMEKLNILVDLSHSNDKTFWDVAKYTKKPFLVSHSNSRTLCPSMRNLTDDQIKFIGEIGGLIGLNSYHNFVSHDEKNKNLSTLVNHLEYIAEKIGIDKVGFGFDFPDYFAKEDENIQLIDNLKDITHSHNIIKELKKRGFSQNDIDLVTHKNFISFFNSIHKNNL